MHANLLTVAALDRNFKAFDSLWRFTPCDSNGAHSLRYETSSFGLSFLPFYYSTQHHVSVLPKEGPHVDCEPRTVG